MTPIAWIVRHRLDKHPREHALYYREEEAKAHAAEFKPGVCTVVPVVDGAEAAARIAELEAEHAEDQGVIAVWRGRTQRAEDRIAELEAALEEIASPKHVYNTDGMRAVARAALKDAP